MTLEDYAAIASIIASIATVLILGTSASVALMLYIWHRDSAKAANARILNEDRRHLNELMLSNQQLHDLEIKRHRWGRLNKDEVVLMYTYLMYLNIAHSALEAYKRNALGRETFESHINNTANLTHKDRDFINQHVLPRGYGIGFQSELKNRWGEIDKNGTLPPA